MSKSLPLGALLIALCLPALQGQTQKPRLTKADIERWMTELSNWGRWGKDDQLGAVNLITDKTRKEAAGLVRSGISVSMAHRLETEKAIDNSAPFSYKLLDRAPDFPYWSDSYSVAYHGYGHTHFDSLSHLMHNGKLYNGVPASAFSAKGASKLSVYNFRNGIFARGILVDIPELKGVPYLEPGTPIYPEDLEAWEKKSGIQIRSGDILLIRTGRWGRRSAKGPWDVGSKSAGLHASCMPWIKKRDVAILGSDAASDVMPSGVEGVEQPVHLLTLVAMGMPIFDNCDFEELSKMAKKLNRWEFLVTAAPLAVEGGTGSPFNPIATF